MERAASESGVDISLNLEAGGELGHRTMAERSGSRVPRTAKGSTLGPSYERNKSRWGRERGKKKKKKKRVLRRGEGKEEKEGSTSTQGWKGKARETGH